MEVRKDESISAMKHLSSWVAGIAMLSVSFIPAFLPAPFWWRIGLTACALLGVAAFGVHLWFQHREDKKREEKERQREARESAREERDRERDEKEKKREETQEERDRLLIHKAIEEYKLSIVATSVTVPVAPPAELGMSPDDPRIYLDIKEGTDAMFHETPFVLDNQGKDAAHTIQIDSFRLNRKPVTFPSVELVSAGSKKETLPTIDNAGPMLQHSIFHWLLKDWDGNGELVEEWPIPVSLTYSDFSKKKRFVTTMKLVFHPIRYMLAERHNNWPQLNRDRPLWEFREIEFKRVS